LSETYAIKRLGGRLWIEHSLSISGIFTRLFGWLVERQLRQIVQLQNIALGNVLKGPAKSPRGRPIPWRKRS
ncbi:hypothetical protein OFC55_36145, partial [Escherichia coli]|nr:hypothetical protein [Escherichia coli]